MWAALHLSLELSIFSRDIIAFAQVDGYFRERLALFLSKKSGRHGRNFERYTYESFRRLGMYRLAGTVARVTASPITTR
jgi:hypothetical protein